MTSGIQSTSARECWGNAAPDRAECDNGRWPDPAKAVFCLVIALSFLAVVLRLVTL